MRWWRAAFSANDRVDGAARRAAAVDVGQQGNRGLSAIQAAALRTFGARIGLMAVSCSFRNPLIEHRLKSRFNQRSFP
jgi:hypothetical protein